MIVAPSPTVQEEPVLRLLVPGDDGSKVLKSNGIYQLTQKNFI
jgi:hypothetical protein